MMYWKRILMLLSVIGFLLGTSGISALAGSLRVIESEPTGFELVDVRTEEGSKGFLIVKAGVRNTTKHSVENVIVYIVAKGFDGKEVRRVYTIVKPPLPLEPGATGDVRISILTRRIPVSVIEYKVVGLL